MEKLNNHKIGVDSGMTHLFTDFNDDGEMWTGQGKRACKVDVTFSEAFVKPPTVQIGFSMWDIANGANTRVDLVAEDISTTGFTIKFQTWGDTKIARLRANWMAIGEVLNEEMWDV